MSPQERINEIANSKVPYHRKQKVWKVTKDDFGECIDESEDKNL